MCAAHLHMATALRKDLWRQTENYQSLCIFFSSTFSFVASKVFDHNLNAMGVIQGDERTSRTCETDISYGHTCIWAKELNSSRIVSGCGWYTWYLAMDNGMGGFRGCRT